MGRKNKKNRLTKPTVAESKTMIVWGVGIVLFVLATFYAGYRLQSTSPIPPGPDQVPVHFNRVEDAIPFPPTLDPAQFQISSIREAYSVARELPEVLVQQPCYCYCQRQGHRSLLDCFRDLHATSCDICINEARLAGRLHRQGKTAEEIRTAIIQKQWANLGSSR